MLQKKWKLLETDPGHLKILSEDLNGHEHLSRLLLSRSIHNYKEAASYFNPSLQQLHDPFLMKDMDKAADRIITALTTGEKIMVFGDYDVDGTSAVATLYQFLHQLLPDESRAASQLYYYIPHRFREGYGVSMAGIEEAAANDITLIISVDCGIKSASLIQQALDKGIEFIICDHHLPDEILPPAVAILNPKQLTCPYPYKDLCGCGIVFKLIQALSRKQNLPVSAYLKYLDLQAIAIAADIVPVTGENRVLAYFGLREINERPNPGIAALLELAAKPMREGNERHPISLSNLVFLIAPRINAAGRMDEGKQAVALLIEKNPEKASQLAERLHENNLQRKEADKITSAEALAMIDECQIMQGRHSTVVYHHSWHKGVVGIVASRLIDSYYRPTVVLAKSGDLVTGSARSIPGFNLYEAVHACREHLIGYGGHFAAAGLTLYPEKIDPFRHAFESYVKENLPEELAIPEIIIDAELDFRFATIKFLDHLQRMEPYGPGNMKPVFVARKVSETGYSRIVGQRQDSQASTHLKVVLEQGGIILSGIGFGMGHRMEELIPAQLYDFVYTLERNEYRGQTTVQLRIIDFKPHV